jgi:RNA polymerase sigma factor (sigma-70 family)
MSPPVLRRYRAERLLRGEFEGQRAKVLAIVRGRLRSQGLRVDEGDLEECYALAWQGLYAKVMGGEEVANPTGWLVLVCFRRAIDEHRARHGEREHVDRDRDASNSVVDLDLARALDDRVRLRQIFEGLRARLSRRECEAATLCYVQGLSRAEAAARMGISEGRMRKLMEGGGAGRPGVAGKVGELLASIRADGFCEEHSSLMRGLAFGILDPHGERYRLAQLHRRECPACRAYVVSLRGLAAVLPPLYLPGGLGAGAGIAPRSGARIASPLVSKPLVSKLAVGFALVVGVGAGGVVLARGDRRHGRAVRPIPAREAAGHAPAGGAASPARVAAASVSRPRELAAHRATARRAQAVARRRGARSSSPRAGASREFTPEGRAVPAPPPASATGARHEFGVE